MHKRSPISWLLAGIVVALLILQACSAARTSRGASVWQRSGSCPATRVDNHVY
ncbi:MAG: hypothetical protein KatS3mg026_0811 [Bacteroidia bacterium]|nr:MAG: hypothetical protein KatS3mg026_0811 [Bacteroidia bacterium]